MNQKNPSNNLATEHTASGEAVAYRDGFSAGAKLIEEITAERDAARAQLAQRAGSGLEAPTIRELQNLDRGKLYDICCRQSDAIKEADKCIKRYQDKLRSGDAQPDSERDAARYRWLRDLSEPGICSFYLSVGKAFEGVKFTRATVDDAIDAQIAAMAAQQRGESGAA